MFESEVRSQKSGARSQEPGARRLNHRVVMNTEIENKI
jgi:hypothetical protein